MPDDGAAGRRAEERAEAELKPRLLDLFCGAGGAAMGYHRAGFEVLGVDLNPQPSYPFRFVQADALEFLQRPHVIKWDAIHASPPCQAYTLARKLQGNEHPDLVAPVRALLQESGLPYVIENVPGSPLIDPVVLCGAMFGLRTYRHRLFETNFHLVAPPHPKHAHKTTKMGRPPQPDEFMHIVGHFSGADEGRWAMGIDWMSKNELRESIPPSFSAYVATYLLEHLGLAVAA